MIVDLTYIKKHLRIESNEENELLTSYAQACEDVIQKYLNVNWDEMYDAYGTIPHAIRNAVCMMVGSMYKNREADADRAFNINPVFKAMLKPYKKIVRYVQ